MKNIITVLFITICSHVCAQDSLRVFSDSRNKITITGMEVLGGWGIINTGAGAVGLSNSNGGANKYFYQMDLIWGATNLGIAILGYTHAQKNKNKALTPSENLKDQQKIEKVFLINGGLDLVYLGTGLYLKDRGDTHNSEQLKGYGSSIIMQGAFLLLFDATMYSAQKHNGSKLINFLQRNPVISNGKQIGMLIHLN